MRGEERGQPHMSTTQMLRELTYTMGRQDRNGDGRRCACRYRLSYYGSSLLHYSAKTWPQRRNRQTRIRGARYTIRRAGERHAATLTPVTSAWHQSRASAAFAYRIYNIALG